MKQLLGMLTVLFFCNAIQAQNTLYTINFGTTGTALPTGWTKTGAASANLVVSSTNPSTNGYTGASGSLNVGDAGTVAGVAELKYENTTTPLTTVGFNAVEVKFGAYKNGYTGTVDLQWSANGTTWTTLVTNISLATNAKWYQYGPVALPAGALNQANIRFKFIFTRPTGTTAALVFRIDDFLVTGTTGATGGGGGGTGTVTSVGLTMPSGFTVSGSPVTTSGTLAASTTLNGLLRGNGSGFTTGAVNLANTDVTGTLPIANGGIGATTATAGLNNLLPSQTGNANKVLQTDGANASWQTPAGGGGSSPWTINVNNITNSNTGNVGIGTGGTDPSAKLDVNGTIKTNASLTVATTIGATWDVSGTHSRISANAGTDAITLLTTKIPSSIRLQVNNGARGVIMDGNSKNFLFMGGSGETLGGIGNANGTGILALLYSAGPNLNTEGARLTTNGNFLVGTTTDAGYKADVNGQLRVATGLHIGPLPINYAAANINISSFTDKSNFANSVMTLSSTETGAGSVYPTQLVFAQENAASGWSLQSVNQGVAYTNITLNKNGGNVAIGNTTPSAQLHTTGSVRFQGLTANNALTNIVVADALGNLSLRDASTLGGSVGSLWTDAGNGNLYNTTQTGSISIGINTFPAGYKLAVAGKIIAEKVTAKLVPNWPDFVFQADYKLLSLNEIEQYIQQYNHLPGVPSAEEVGKNGLDLGDNQAVLLKKIEELTLHMINMNKKLEVLQAENAALRKSNEH